MSQLSTAPSEWRPLILRIVSFPLAAMIAAVALFVATSVLGTYLGKFVPAWGQPATAAVHMVITVSLVFAVYKLAIVRFGERPVDDLPARGAVRNLALGLATGALLYCLVVGVAAAIGVYRITGEGGASMLLLGIISEGVIPGFMEELLFRGILFRWLEEFAGSWTALVITSALFGLAHILNPGATWFSSFAIAIEAGLMLGGAYMLTRSLWLPIGLHAAWNVMQGPVFGVPVSGNPAHGILRSTLSGPPLLSGGSFGLEASVIALAICTVAGGWFVWRAIERGEVMQPMWLRRSG